MPEKKPRKKRVRVGDRDAETGQFVTAEYAEENPATTVAVTKEVEPEAPQVEDPDPEC